jgi:hypothetical protein
MFIMACAGIPPAIINSTDPLKFQEFPNYIWIYIHHHVSAIIGALVIIMILFLKRPGPNAIKLFVAAIANFAYKPECLSQAKFSSLF